ncbi:hypothetical protein D9C73_021694 [Collichthys lucidus]|uniref:Uncharacterized protein n=1 Tax=Collichthys lucidus TaxID=240159 RepID=A0A4U5VIG9_COLLU|nr:hypothetical protein D9C73_021694 [Collichthys lucidus]
MSKMRGLTLLCLVGFILSASLPKGNAAPNPPQEKEKPELDEYTGVVHPFEGEGGFETPELTTQQVLGFNSTNSTPTATPSVTTHTGYIVPFQGEGVFRPVASVENAQQAAKNKD